MDLNVVVRIYENRSPGPFGGLARERFFMFIPILSLGPAEISLVVRT